MRTLAGWKGVQCLMVANDPCRLALACSLLTGWRRLAMEELGHVRGTGPSLGKTMADCATGLRVVDPEVADIYD